MKEALADEQVKIPKPSTPTGDPSPQEIIKVRRGPWEKYEDSLINTLIEVFSYPSTKHHKLRTTILLDNLNNRLQVVSGTSFIEWAPATTLSERLDALYKLVNIMKADEPSIGRSNINELLNKTLGSVPEVMAVYISRENGDVSVWTFLNNKDKEVRTMIYDLEMKVMETCHDINFDFHVILCREDELSEVIPSNTEMVFKRN